MGFTVPQIVLHIFLTYFVMVMSCRSFFVCFLAFWVLTPYQIILLAKYFLPFIELPFILLIAYLFYAQEILILIWLTCLFLTFYLCFWCHIYWCHWQIQCHDTLPLYFLLKFYMFYLLCLDFKNHFWVNFLC